MSWGAAIAAVASVASTALSNSGAGINSKKGYKYSKWLLKYQTAAQKELNEQSYAQQEKLLKMEQAYDKMMSDTAVQRQMQDYLNSGVNPAMVVAGQGASTPTATAPSASAGSAGAPSIAGPQTFSYGDAVTQAINAYSAKNQKDIQDEQNRIAKQNAITSGERDIAQARYYQALEANEIEKNPLIAKKIKSEIAQENANTAKTMHELETGTLGKTIGKQGTDTINDIAEMVAENLRKKFKK